MCRGGLLIWLVGCVPEWDPPATDWVRHGEPLLRAGSDAGDGKVEIVIGDPCIRQDADGVWRLWYQGSRAETYTDDDIDMWIRHATSADGYDWQVDAAPALTTPDDPGAWDASHTETPSVTYNPDAPPERRWLMAYSGASRQLPLGFPDYQIGVAFSADGVHFTRLPAEESPYGEAGAALRVEEALADVSGLVGGVVADPEVVYADGVYHLFYSSFGHDADDNFLAFGVGHATSADGVRWEPVVAAPIPELLNGEGVSGQQPSVSYNAAMARWEMAFTLDSDDERRAMPSTFNPSMGTWMATSADLMTWNIDYSAGRDFYWQPEADNEELGLLTGASLITVGDEQRLFYTGWGSRGVPDGFVVPVHSGTEPAVLNLLVATRASER